MLHNISRLCADFFENGSCAVNMDAIVDRLMQKKHIFKTVCEFGECVGEIVGGFHVLYYHGL